MIKIQLINLNRQWKLVFNVKLKGVKTKKILDKLLTVNNHNLTHHANLINYHSKYTEF